MMSAIVSSAYFNGAPFSFKNLKHLNKKKSITLGMKSNQNRNRKTKSMPVKSKNSNKQLIAGIVIFLIVIGIVAYAVLRGNPGTTSPTTPTATPTTSPVVSPSPFNPSVVVPLTSPAGEYSASGTKVLLQTSMGNIVIQMRDDKPITTNNFVNLVKEGIYNGTIFHRVIAGFMIQGGMNSSANIAMIPDEIGNDNVNSNMTIAMANAGANTATSQFFINVANNNNLYSSFDTSYTVFGQVIYGQDVVMKISEVPTVTNAQGEQSQPTQTITLIGATILP